jgi:hypothetical protein
MCADRNTPVKAAEPMKKPRPSVAIVSDQSLQHCDGCLFARTHGHRDFAQEWRDLIEMRDLGQEFSDLHIGIFSRLQTPE